MRNFYHPTLCDLQVVKALQCEIELLRILDHERIIQYYGSEETTSVLSVFLEYMPEV